jgi:RHH-type transcriptional regulator, proline utilization regulon repressor / proline dehydrogenase / delta 1-pyrroline-5-carboxylate dehydrogenase
MAPVMNDSLDAWFQNFDCDAKSSASTSAQKAIFLARRLQERAAQLQTAAERRQQAELDRMLQTPSDKATLAQMTDQAFRTNEPARAVEHLVHILDVQGVPRFFSPIDRTLLKGFQSFGGYAPGVALPLVKEHMQKETANVILPAERAMLAHHLRERRREGIRMNVNFLGEAILSEAEAERRLQQCLQTLQWDEIEVLSIKISTLYSQISPLAREHTVTVLCDRLERLLRTAARTQFTRPDGRVVPKFVYLDMEEYRDKELTAEAFMRTLDRGGLEQAGAGIALQSYIPDSFQTLLQIQQWARQRRAAGGGRITIRLVKGANMESERVEASVRGWPQAPYRSKRETDANFKRMVHEMMKPENLAAMNVGIASHNLFDLAYGLVLARERNAFDKVQFEMLEGMANHQRRAVFELTRHLLLYAPACQREHFINAIGYLIRRLDENTGPENFLRHAFKISVGNAEWQKLEQGFLESFDAIPTTSAAPRRTQDRGMAPAVPGAVAKGWQNFVNEPDTDFALPQNGEWAKSLLAKWEPLCGARAPQIPLVIGGGDILQGRPLRDCLDPSRPGVVVGRYRQASGEDAARAVECAAADPDGWRTMPVEKRFAILGQVAQELRVARGDLMGAALANGGKTLLESDPEVSEAVDFVEFYRSTARWWQERPTLQTRGGGVVVVLSPWNFPIAIPCGGMAAALAAGNTVILKPASDAVLVAWELCQCFWRGGVSKNALQLVTGSGSGAGRNLVNHPKVHAVILTGGTETARGLLREHPRLNLFAETGGKNATIVTALADRDQAVKHIVHSAFSHAGQKCSATSLLLLEAEIYHDANFRRALCEAVQSLAAGSAWKLETKIGPLIRPPGGDLENALKVLEPGEQWATMPQNLEGNPRLWSPGVKYGVPPGNQTHLTEFFGPLLAVMRFDKLSEAVALVNQTGYGLTSGLESLDEREWDYWKEHVRAGNLYINRVTTGAVVLRQPFGGIGKSCFGPGMKAGGPNYVAQFMEFADAVPELPADAGQNPELAGLCEELRKRAGELGPGGAAIAARVAVAAVSYERSMLEEFGREHDHFRLVGQDNFRRYRPLHYVRVRVHADDSPFDLLARVCAVHIAGSRVTVSVPRDFASPALKLLEQMTESWAAAIEFVEESDEELAGIVRQRQTDRVRYAAPDRVPRGVLEAAGESGVCVVSKPVLTEGRVELLWYLQEQSLSIDYHRYGNLGTRAGEPRADVL